MTRERHPAIMFAIDGSVRNIIAGRKTQTRRLGDKKPAYRVGDECWVRETWTPIDSWIDGFDREDPTCIGYKDDLRGIRWEGSQPLTPRPIALDVRCINWDRVTWRPPIYFPKFASRLSIRIVELRTEQLQRMTDADAIAEGAHSVDDFASRWNAHYGHGAWTTNPIVHAYRFEVTRCVA